MSFRERLLGSLRALRPVLEVDGVMILGSEVPNLLEPQAACTLVVSQDVDIGVPVARHDDVKRALRTIEELRPSPDEPSVWVPSRPDLLEVNFIGVDPTLGDAGDTYVLQDDELPLLVFGQLALVRPGRTLEVEGALLPLPRPAGLALEKLLTDRSGVKGDRDLLVVLGLLLQASTEDLDELVGLYRALAADLRHAVRSNLTVLSLLDTHPSMPDPAPHREMIASLLERLEEADPDAER